MGLGRRRSGAGRGELQHAAEDMADVFTALGSDAPEWLAAQRHLAPLESSPSHLETRMFIERFKLFIFFISFRFFSFRFVSFHSSLYFLSFVSFLLLEAPLRQLARGGEKGSGLTLKISLRFKSRGREEQQVNNANLMECHSKYLKIELKSQLKSR